MNGERLKALVHQLELPKGSYALFGGTILAALNIRDARDIDVFVDDTLFEELVERGWQKTSEQQRSPYLSSEVDGVPVQAFNVWEGGEWKPDIAGYIATPEIVDDLPFMPLRELYDWKVATRRPKDLEDIAIIDAYWLDK